ncbi:MAG: hypothetical protein HYT39_04130 [Candidatus Sungbacteria bacterium]|nr:hypothetical protein [Candidatus Sungbacteria bacterium]
MTFSQFLKWGGVALIGIAILGAILPGGKLFGNSWNFTSAENWGHFMAGAILLIAWYLDFPWLNKKLAYLVALTAFYFVLAGFLVRDLTPLNYYNIANFEYPWDELLHLVFVIWPAYVIQREKRSS